MCGVQATVLMPSATAMRAISSAISRSAAPSSMPGRRRWWRSIIGRILRQVAGAAGRLNRFDHGSANAPRFACGAHAALPTLADETEWALRHVFVCALRDWHAGGDWWPGARGHAGRAGDPLDHRGRGGAAGHRYTRRRFPHTAERPRRLIGVPPRMSNINRERRRGAPLDPDALREGLTPA